MSSILTPKLRSLKANFVNKMLLPIPEKSSIYRQSIYYHGHRSYFFWPSPCLDIEESVMRFTYLLT